MKQIIALYLGAVALILLVGWISQDNNLNKLFQSLPLANQNTETIAKNADKIIFVGDKEFKIEVAKNSEERKVGLTKYQKLPDGYGMLFVFPEKSRPRFWMKNMKFPIDIIWIADGKVTQITHSVPPALEGVPDAQIPLYEPNQTVDYVLEIGAGQAKKNGIKIGDDVKIPNL